MIKKTAFLFLLGLISLQGNLLWSKERIIKEEWYSVYLLGMKAGFFGIKIKEESKNNEKIYTYYVDSKITMKHFGKKVEQKVKTILSENQKGKLIEFENKMDSEIESYHYKGKAKGNILKYTKKIGGKVEHLAMTLPEDLMLYYRIDQFMMQKGLKPGTKYEYKSFDPDNPSVIKNTKVWVKNKEKVALFKTQMELHCLEIIDEGMPGLTIKMYVDSNFNPWLIDFGIMEMKFYRTEQASALQEVQNDFSFLSFIQPSGTFNNGETIDSASLKITPMKEQLLNFPSDQWQKAEKNGDSVLIKIKKNPLPLEKISLPFHDKGLMEFLASSPLIQTSHPEIKALSKKVVGEEKDAVAIVKKINLWVFKNIKKKNFNILYDSALEVSRKLEGDCTEHSVLFAGLARAAGIPTRIVMGLVYVDGIYGYHQWAEVWLNGWYAVDPTLNQETADASHIFLNKVSLNQTASENMAEYLPLLKIMGNIKIEILDSQ